jgi:hypothetical protein
MRLLVAFDVEKGAGTVENMHAKALPNGNFILENVPFHAYGISLGDEFSVTTDSERLVFGAVVRRSGHSTYRVKLPRGGTHEDFMRYWPDLEALGCGFEGSSADQRHLYAIDVPAGTDVAAVYDLLEQGEEQGRWVFEEGHHSGMVGSGKGA